MVIATHTLLGEGREQLCRILRTISHPENAFLTRYIGAWYHAEPTEQALNPWHRAWQRRKVSLAGTSPSIQHNEQPCFSEM